MENYISHIAYWLAFVISIGSLIFYLRLAIKSRRESSKVRDTKYDFNLGTPSLSRGFLKMRNNEQVFAYALVAAGTSLSTVFLFFLTASSFFGWLIFLSPLMFAVGNFVMFKVYNRAEINGYFEENNSKNAGITGLVPFLGQSITGSKEVGVILVLVSFLNLLAVLVLELFIGADVISYLSHNTLNTALSTPGNFSWMDFTIFSISIILLLSYVFIGGFRAVLSSDFYQMKAMKSTILIVLISLIIRSIFTLSSFDHSFLNIKATGITLIGFIVNVILANLFVPMSQESSWQRFRAFKTTGFNFDVSMKKSITNSLLLWVGLIIISFVLILLVGNKPMLSISEVLSNFKSVDNLWFPLCVFPLITSACLFAMYSTADTCVSALIYLIDYFYSMISLNKNKTKLLLFHKVGMVFILSCSILIYLFIHTFFNPTILQLVFSVFSNLVVIAPTIILTYRLKPHISEMKNKYRTTLVLTSLSLGISSYWLCSVFSIIKGGDYLWLSQLSILAGLTFAIIPITPLLIRPNK